MSDLNVNSSSKFVYKNNTEYNIILASYFQCVCYKHARNENI